MPDLLGSLASAFAGSGAQSPGLSWTCLSGHLGQHSEQACATLREHGTTNAPFNNNVKKPLLHIGEAMRLRAMRGVNEQLVTLQKLLDGCDAAAKFGTELISGQSAANHLPTGETLL